MEDQDVTPAEDSSPAAPDTQTAGAVKPEGDDRPIKNVRAEFDRKFTKVERQQMEIKEQLTAIGQFLAANHQTQQPARPAQTNEPDTDEMLWSRAQAGDRLAFEEYQRRIARREVQQDRTVTSQTNLVQAQMQALYAKYPVFNDGQHPLTQTAQQAYQLLVRNGRPQGQETLLQAAMTAIAERPDLVSDLYAQGAQTREGARRSATQAAHTGQMGASVRRDAPRSGSDVVTVKPGEVAIARRMLSASKLHPEEKTPEQRAKGAKERFLARQANGESKLGAVSGFVNAEDF